MQWGGHPTNDTPVRSQTGDWTGQPPVPNHSHTLFGYTALTEQSLSRFFASSGVPRTTLPISLRQSEVGSPESVFLHVSNWLELTAIRGKRLVTPTPGLHGG